MKNFIMAILLGAFVFITLHDFILKSIDYDTQQEIVLLDNNRISIDAICDTSKIHYHLHESLLSFNISKDSLVGIMLFKTYMGLVNFQKPLEFIIFDIYRPPIQL